MKANKDTLILQIYRQVEKVASATIGSEDVPYRELQDRVIDLRAIAKELLLHETQE